MKFTNTQRGFLTLFGGFTIHLVIGAVFMWGTLNVYITSYFRQLNDDGLSLSVGGAIFPVMMLSVASGMPLGIKAIQIFGSARYYSMVGSIICSFLVFISSYCTKFWQYVLIYGVAFGIVSGTLYFIPIYMGYLFFPKKKGLVSGTVLAGYGLCSLVMGMTFFSFVNPDNLSQQKNDDGYSYFEGPSISVAQKVPEVLRTMSLIYVILSVFGSFFLMYHPNQIGEEERRLKQQLKEKKMQEDKLKDQLQILSIEKFTAIEQEEDLKEVKQQEKIEKMVEKKIEIVKLNIATIEKTEKIIEKQIELQISEDEKQAYLPEYYNYTTTNQQSGNEIQTKPLTQTDLEEGLSAKQREQNYCYLTSQGNSCETNEIQNEDQNRQAHMNDFILKIENEIKKLEESVRKEEQDQIHRKQSMTEKEKDIEEYNKLGAPNAMLVFKQPQYYMSLVLAFLAIGFPIIINGNFKTVAKDYGYLSDSYQTMVGALVSIANGLSRPVYASLLDKFTFKQILTCVICIQIFLSLTLQLTDVSEVFFAIWIFLVNTTFGGVLAMWPVFSAQLNGVKIGSKIYGTYWWAFGFANFVQFLFVHFLKKEIGFNNIFYIYTGIATASLLILRSYNFRIEWSKYYLKQEKKQQEIANLEVLTIKPMC